MHRQDKRIRATRPDYKNDFSLSEGEAGISTRQADWSNAALWIGASTFL
jgi:hypothetical protein